MIRVFIIIMICSNFAFSLRLYSIFQPGCKRTTGLMAFVDNTHLHVLTPSGNLEAVPLFQISGIVEYSLPQFPLAMIAGSKSEAVAFRFYGSQANVKELIAEGFVTDFNKSSLQIYDVSGQEKLVLRDQIWAIESDKWTDRRTQTRFEQSPSFKLRSPIVFEHCKDERVGGASGTVLTLVPERTYANVVARKEFIDQRRDEYERLLRYESHQQFYAQPNIYYNRTRMGTWLSLNTRYTNVGVRQTNFLPFIEDEFSSDIFSYQHVIKSGSIPVRWSFQDEPQLQVYYGLKADYIHLDMFLDPSVILLGEKYQWSSEQIKSVDDRFVEMFGLKFGLDYEKISLFVVVASGEGGIRNDQYFMPQNMDALRGGLAFFHHDMSVDFSAGNFHYTQRRKNDTADLNFIELIEHKGPTFRLNLSYQPQNYGVELAYIYRQVSSQRKDLFNYEGASHIFCLEYGHAIARRWRLFLRPSIEQLDRVGKSETVPKAATGLSLQF
jgi:hypothetical protein